MFHMKPRLASPTPSCICFPCFVSFFPLTPASLELHKILAQKLDLKLFYKASTLRHIHPATISLEKHRLVKVEEEEGHHGSGSLQCLNPAGLSWECEIFLIHSLSFLVCGAVSGIGYPHLGKLGRCIHQYKKIHLQEPVNWSLCRLATYSMIACFKISNFKEVKYM